MSHISSIEAYATDQGLTLVKFLKSHTEKLCLTYTSKLFTGSCNAATRRGEGFMSVLKGKGTLKKLMNDFSLFDILHQYDIIVHDYKEKVKKRTYCYVIVKQDVHAFCLQGFYYGNKFSVSIQNFKCYYIYAWFNFYCRAYE